MDKKFKSILLIDDNAADNRYSQIIIEEMNIAENIRVANNAVEALSLLELNDDCPPDLILLDINMPKMNGWEFLETYKELNIDRDKNEIIVVLTTSINPEDKKKADNNPMVSEFKVKPLTADSLKVILEKYRPR